MREREGARERERKREGERDVEYGCFIFIFKRNDGCLGIFKSSSKVRVRVKQRIRSPFP